MGIFGKITKQDQLQSITSDIPTYTSCSNYGYRVISGNTAYFEPQLCDDGNLDSEEIKKSEIILKQNEERKNKHASNIKKCYWARKNEELWKKK